MAFIILDRDGVINEDSPAYIKNPEEWRPIPGSLDAIAKLNQAGFQVFVVTNQSGIGRGFYDVAMLEAIHAKLHTELKKVGGKIEAIFFCPHRPDENCICRKPKIGMLQSLSKVYPISFSETYFVGDSVGDIEAANASGCKPLLVLTGNGAKTLAHYANQPDFPVAEDLQAAVKLVLALKSETV